MRLYRFQFEPFGRAVLLPCTSGEAARREAAVAEQELSRDLRTAVQVAVTPHRAAVIPLRPPARRSR